MRPFIYFAISFIALLSQNFNTQEFDRILKTYVNDKGFVNYKAILDKEKNVIDKLVKQANLQSPNSKPSAYKSEKEKMVFWINVYNLMIIKTIINDYPTESIKDIYFPGWRVWKINHQVGGENLSFDNIEHDILRKRFKEPRVHFAINCASYGCPILQNKAFTSENLESLLQKGTRDFFESERNFRIDKEEKKIYLSSILDWFEEDFFDESKGETILNFVIRFAPNEIANFVKKNKSDYKVEYIPYDWKLNKQ